MNFRTTYYLLGTAGAVIAGFFVYVFFVASDKPSGEGYLLPSFQAASVKPSDINTVEIERTTPDRETLVFVRQGKDRWKLTKPVEARVDSNAVEAVVRDLLNARREEKGVDVRDRKTHGLEDPPVKVTLKQGVDRTGTVSIGDVTAGGDKAVVYVLSSESKDDRPWVTRKSSLSALFKFPAPEGATDTAALVRWVNDFRSTKLLGDVPDPLGQTESVRIEEGKSVVALSRRPDGNWKFDRPADYGSVETEGAFSPSPADNRVTNLRGLLQNIFNIQVTSPKDFIDKPEDLAKYGLNPDNPDLLRIQIERRPQAGEKVEKDTLLVGKSSGVPGDKFYAKLADESVVAEVAGINVRAVKAVLEDPKALRNRDLVHLAKDKVDAIDIEHAGGKVELRLVGEPPAWKVYDAAGNPQPANRAAVDELIAAVTAPRLVTDFPPANTPDSALGLDAKDRAGEVRIWLGGVIKEEPKKDETKKDEGKKDEAGKAESKNDAGEAKKDGKDAAKKDEAKKEEPKKDAAPARPRVAADPAVRLVFGKETGDGVFVRKLEGGAKTDVVVPRTLLAQVRKTRLDFLEVSLPPLAPDQVVRIQFNKGKDAYDIEKENKDAAPAAATWKLVSPADRKGRLADTGRVSGLLSQLSLLRPVRVAAEKPSAEQLAKMGLAPDAPHLKITLTLKEGAPGAKERVYLFGNETAAGGANVYARVAGQDVVFEAPKSVPEGVEKGDFLDAIVYRVDRAKVKGLKLRGWADIVGEAVTRELELKSGRWDFKAPVGYEIDPGKVDTFLDDVLSPRAESFVVLKTGPTPEQGLDLKKGSLEIEIEVEGGKPVTLTLGATDSTGKLVYAQTNQLPGDVFTLLKDRFKTVREKPAVFKND